MCGGAKRGLQASAEIVGVGLDLHLQRSGRDQVILEPIALTEGDGLVPGLEVDAHLRVGVARPVPASQRVGAERLLTLELQQP